MDDKNKENDLLPDNNGVLVDDWDKEIEKAEKKYNK